MHSQLRHRLDVVALGLVFTLSGAAGLVYEVSWVRMLTRIFGNTTHAVATVLAAFMAGLALGSYAFSKLRRPTLRSLEAYAALEAFVGLYGLVVPSLFDGLNAAYPKLHAVGGVSPILLQVLVFTVTFGVIVLPTALMGATLPLLSNLGVKSVASVGRVVGILYALNTLGAVLGCAACGFVLIETFGLATTVRFAALANLVAAFVAFGLARRDGDPAAIAAAPPPPVPVAPDVVARAARLDRTLVVACAFSGGAAMVLENGWTRALTLVLGASTYSFTVMLTTFLVGLALGSLVFGVVERVRDVRVSDLGFLQAAVALTTLLTVPLFECLPKVFVSLTTAWPSAEGSLTPAFLVSAFVMIVPTTLLGATFPLVARLYARELDGVGHRVGAAYAANTLGSILGSVLGGFVVLPLLGIQRTVELAVLVFAAIAVVLLAVDRTRAWRYRTVAAAATGVAVVFGLVATGTWDKRVMTSGVFYYYREVAALPTDSLRDGWFHHEDLIFYREGLNGTVSVHARPGRDHYSLRTSGKVDASSTGDMRTQLLLGYIPALLAPECSRVLVIGLGSGVTAKTFAAFPEVKEIEIAEIEPAVIEAAKHFSHVNDKVHEDKRVRFRIGDARNLISVPGPAYDIISAEPSNFFVSGVGSLYTQEFYRSVLARLTPDGLFGQWLQIYNLPPEDVQAICRTFASVFPEASLWRTDGGDLLLVGSRQPIALRVGPIAQRLATSPVARADLRALGLEGPLSLAPFHMLDRACLVAFTGAGPTLKDDLPHLEFAAARTIGRPTDALTNALLTAHLTGVQCPDMNPTTEPSGRAALDLARGCAALNDLDAATRWLERSLECDPGNLAARLLRCRVDARAGRQDAAVLALEELLANATPETIEVASEIAQGLRGEPGAALIAKILERVPGHLATRILRGRRLFESGQQDAAAAVHRETSALHPTSALAVEGLARCALWHNDFAEAIRLGQRALALGPPSDIAADTHALIGTACWKLGRNDEAIEQFRLALQDNNRFADWRLRLGECLARRKGPGDRREAAQVFRDLLALEPDNVEAWQRLRDLGEPF